MWCFKSHALTLYFLAVIAAEDTEVIITYTVSSNDLHVDFNNHVYSKNDVMTVNLKANEVFQLSASVDLTGIGSYC